MQTAELSDGVPAFVRLPDGSLLLAYPYGSVFAIERDGTNRDVPDAVRETASTGGQERDTC